MDGAGAAGGVSVLLLSLVGSTVRLAAPLVLAALAGLYAERSGVVDVGLEGKILTAAFAGAAALLLALLHGIAAIAAGGDQIVSGMALNLIAAGATRASLRHGSGSAARRRPYRTGRASVRSHCPSPSR